MRKLATLALVSALAACGGTAEPTGAPTSLDGTPMNTGGAVTLIYSDGSGGTAQALPGLGGTHETTQGLYSDGSGARYPGFEQQ